ncbi:MAG: hypothetical protein ACKVUS_14475 [Saprospiraceae bacterium]
MQQPFTHALVADLLSAFESATGFPLGTATHLQVQELLRRLPGDIKPERLKTLLSPVLCKDEDEQARFYAIFDKSLEQRIEVEKELGKLLREYPEPSKWKPKWNWATAATILTLMALWALGHWSGMASPKEIQFGVPMFVSIRLGDTTKTLAVDSMKWDRHIADRIADFHKIQGDTAADLRVDAPAGKIYYSGFRVGADTVSLRVYPKRWQHAKIWRQQIVFSVRDTARRIDPLPTRCDSCKYAIPYPRDPGDWEPPTPTALQQFLFDYEYPIKAAAILLSGLLLWMIVRRIKRARNPERILAEYKPNTKSPFTWNVHVDQPPVTFSDLYRELVQQLRRREQDDQWRLDMPRTVRATVDKGGLPQLRFSRRTRPAEYLLLIDRHYGRNHQDRHFDMLYRAFKSQDVLVDRYWADEGDARHVWNEKHPKGLSLRDLYTLHPNSRVLLLSHGDHLLSNDTGNVTKWAAKNFSAWNNRGVLTPQPLSTFGRRERRLQEMFQVLPASLSGFRDAVELFNNPEERTPKLDPRRFPDAAQEPVQIIDNDLIKTLHHYFKEAKSTALHGEVTDESITPLTLWVAACAVHVELHWDLTLYLGQLLSGLPAEAVAQAGEKDKLLTSENLALLSRFPWFVEGKIPLEARKALLTWLEREHPDTLYLIREGLHNILKDKKNEPTLGSAAHDEWGMNLAINERLYTKDPIRKKELGDEIQKRIAAGQEPDFMVLRMFDPTETLTPEQFEVPEDWRKHLQENAPAEAKTLRPWMWALPLWLLLCAGILAWKPPQLGCKGRPISLDGKEWIENSRMMHLSSIPIPSEEKEWCAESVEELLQINEMSALAALDKGDLPKADSLKNEILRIGRENQWTNKSLGGDVEIKPIDSVTYFQNLAVGYYNRGVTLRNPSLASDYMSCAYFLRAQELNALLPFIEQLGFVREGAARCYAALPFPPPKDLYLRGRLLDAATNQAIAAISEAKVEAQGLQPGIVAKGGYFSLELPDDWDSPVRLIVNVPGYEPYSGTVYPASFDKSIIIRLYNEIDCYAQMISQGQRAMQETDYERAAALFRAAKNCSDADAQRRKAASDLIESARDAAEAKLNDLRKKLDRDGDGDGVPDLVDKCPDVKGLIDNDGCPDGDRDGDGVPDQVDKCPDEKGTVGNGGCPIIREQLLGFWLLDAVELGQSVKILIEVRDDDQIVYRFFTQENQLLQSFIESWNVKDRILNETNEGRAAIKGSIEKLDNQNFALKIIDNGNPAKVGLVRNYRRPSDRDSDGVPDLVDKCPDVKGEINGGCPDKSGSAEMPQFPFPPPPSSSSSVLSSTLFSRCRTLDDVDDQLKTALNKSGYEERAYFDVPNGFAVATRLEQFQRDGSSMKGGARWSPNAAVKFDGVWDYLQKLITAEQGYFRVFVFIVTDQAFTSSGGSSTSGSGERFGDIKDASGWLSQALNRLPSSTGNRTFSKSYKVTVLVYEYTATASDKSVLQRLPGTLPSNTHLEKSGIMRGLKK